MKQAMPRMLVLHEESSDALDVEKSALLQRAKLMLRDLDEVHNSTRQSWVREQVC